MSEYEAACEIRDAVSVLSDRFPQLSLRDYFAAAALAGAAATMQPKTEDHIAWNAWRLADAMLAERKRRGDV